MLSPTAYEQQRLSPLGGGEQSLEQQQSKATNPVSHRDRDPRLARSLAELRGSRVADPRLRLMFFTATGGPLEHEDRSAGLLDVASQL
jgi:hypothetical protein